VAVAALVTWPLATLAVNLVGSFLIGLVAAATTAGSGVAVLLMGGVLGGFTTFSAFSFDTMRLVESGRLEAAALYVAGSVALSLTACWVGLMLGRLA
jgi:CrcB protein